MAGKRQRILTQKGNKQHKVNVKGAIKNGLLQGTARMEFLKQPAIKKQMQDWYKKQQTKLIKQSI